jgi:hypothetical protein
MFNNRREVWVKVLGVPLHVWGENFFKHLGARFGEFVDFDADTASRSRLDVARIKINTPCRNFIEYVVHVNALGCVYKVWVVEEKSVELPWLRERRDEGDDYSFVDSAVHQKKAVVVNIGSDCSSGEEDTAVEVPEPNPNGHLPRVDVTDAKSNSPLLSNGEKRQGGNCQTDFGCVKFKVTSTPRDDCRPKQGGVIKTGAMVQMDGDKEGQVGVGSAGVDERCEEERLVALNAKPAGGIIELTGGASGCIGDSDESGSVLALSDPIVMGMERAADSDPGRAPESFSPDLEFGGLRPIFSVNGPGGVFIGDRNRPNNRQMATSSISESLQASVDRLVVSSHFPYIQKNKSKHKSRPPHVGVPKCIQFEEAVKQGRQGARKKKGKGGAGSVQGIRPPSEDLGVMERGDGEAKGWEDGDW